MKSEGPKRNKRRSQRFRAATGLRGIERSTGAVVQVRDFSSEAIAVESPVRVFVSKPVELEFSIGGEAFVLPGTVVRTDRLPTVGAGPNYLMVIEVAWHTTSERVQAARFLLAVRKSVRAA